MYFTVAECRDPLTDLLSGTVDEDVLSSVAIVSVCVSPLPKEVSRDVLFHTTTSHRPCHVPVGPRGTL
jgi:hypothetical protein